MLSRSQADVPPAGAAADLTRAPSGAPAPALDDLMLAMDVVDTLRHQEAVALRELAQDGRDAALKARLREIYEGQGLVVSDRILDEGLTALKDSRFTYTPTPPGTGRLLADLWIRRGAIGAGLAIALVVAGAVLGWSTWQRASAERAAEAARIELAETLPHTLATAGAAALAEARTTEASAAATRLQAEGAAALARGDRAGVTASIAALDRLRAALVQTYDLRIVSAPGERSGVFRVPDVNSSARNYYLIVEAVTPDGTRLSLPVRNEETGKTETVSRWGVRVPQATYEAVRRDKTDDGILQNDVVAQKPRGGLAPVPLMPLSGGAITKW